MKTHYPVALSIAGSDSSGGAGIQADIKTMSATGSFSATVITALTAQNTQGVYGIHTVPGDFVFQQMQAVFADLDVCAVKIGMLFNTEIIDAVLKGFEIYKPKNIVLDPVMVAKSGAKLLSENSVSALKILCGHVNLITPNIPEAEKFLNKTIDTLDAMEAAARQLAEEFNTHVLLKGGHLIHSKISADVLYAFNTKKASWFQTDRILTNHTHGTGCTLSAAIASYLAQDYALEEAIQLAKNYLQAAIKAGEHLHIGKGQGPLKHFF